MHFSGCRVLKAQHLNVMCYKWNLYYLKNEFVRNYYIINKNESKNINNFIGRSIDKRITIIKLIRSPSIIFISRRWCLDETFNWKRICKGKRRQYWFKMRNWLWMLPKEKLIILDWLKRSVDCFQRICWQKLTSLREGSWGLLKWSLLR